jgi:hypothetical protein
MASFNKFQQFVEDLGNKVHDLVGTNDTLVVYLSNATPDAAADAVKADLAEISTGNGYTGPQDTQNDGSESGGTLTVTGVDITITAAGGSIGPFRYAVLANDTPAGDPLIGWWDYGSAITLNDTEQLLIDFGASMFTIT